MRQIWDQHIPNEYRRDNKHKLHKDFTFHAKHVSDGTKYPHWAEESRRALLKSMMAIPGEFEIPITFAAVKRGAFDWSGWPEKHKKQMTPAKSDHLTAFTACIAEANKFVRTEYEDELAQIIADDNGEMREILRIALNDLQGRPLPVGVVAPRTRREPESRTELLRADRVIDEVSFLTPRNAPFLQIVDGCAFGLRRYLAGQSQGEDYLYAVSGARALEFPAKWHMFFATIHHKNVIATPPPNRVILIQPAAPEIR
jgi:hypothetical protein